MHEGFFTTSDNVRLHYMTVGEGEPVVLLSGFSLPCTCWEQNVEELAHHYRVCAFDYRAHGQSEAPGYGYQIERLTKDFAEFVDFLGLETFSVIGHSMGNTLVWDYLSLYGGARVKKFVQVDQAPCMVADPSWGEEDRRRWLGLVHDRDMFDFGDFGKLFDDPTPANAGLKVILHNHFARDWRREVERVDVPTLIVMGGKSHNAEPLLWEWLRQAIKGSEFATIGADEGGSHDLYSENSEKFNALVLDFLGR